MIEDCDDFSDMELIENASSYNTPNVPCVYLLFHDWELEYIGQTSNLKKRISSHITLRCSVVGAHQSKQFDKVMFKICKNKIEREVLELTLIERYKPMYNEFMQSYL